MGKPISPNWMVNASTSGQALKDFSGAAVLVSPSLMDLRAFGGRGAQLIGQSSAVCAGARSGLRLDSFGACGVVTDATSLSVHAAFGVSVIGPRGVVVTPVRGFPG